VAIFCPEVNQSNFTHSHLDLKKFSRGETPRTLAYMGGERKGGEGKRLKGSYTSKGNTEGKDRGEVIGMGVEKEGRGPAAGLLQAILLQGLKGG